jgi:putative AbiEii toxin of type IV toxin-antitoxin system
MITSCEIHNFRCFKNLHLKGLQRFTFVVGASGSGKTAFLEGMFLTGGSSAEIAFRIRRWRGLGESAMELSGTRDSFDAIFSDMFHNFDKDAGLTIKFNDTERGWRSLEVGFDRDKGTLELPLGKGTKIENVFLTAPINFKWENPQRVMNSKVEVKNGELRMDATPDVFPIIFISPRTSSAKFDAQRFSELSRKNRSDQAVKAIKRIFPEILGITLETIAGEMVLHAQIEGINEKLPLVDLSAGLNKYLSIVLSILINRQGTVLVDEIENGFYYANLPVILDGLFDICDQEKVQLIASTHSYEFLQSLVKAMDLRGKDGKGFSCIRFERLSDNLSLAQEPTATLIEGSSMKSAIESNFEIR